MASHNYSFSTGTIRIVIDDIKEKELRLFGPSEINSLLVVGCEKWHQLGDDLYKVFTKEPNRMAKRQPKLPLMRCRGERLIMVERGLHRAVAFRTGSDWFTQVRKSSSHWLRCVVFVIRVKCRPVICARSFSRASREAYANLSIETVRMSFRLSSVVSMWTTSNLAPELRAFSRSKSLEIWRSNGYCARQVC